MVSLVVTMQPYLADPAGTMKMQFLRKTFRPSTPPAGRCKPGQRQGRERSAAGTPQRGIPATKNVLWTSSASIRVHPRL